MASQAGQGGETAAGSHRNYVLFLLASAYLLNYFDRSIVNVLLESIKGELKLSDTALGFITGLGFAFLYAVLGLPLSRLADARGRKPLVATGLALWSLMTAIGGAATSGLQLALARTGVGIGEAAGTAPSVAMIADNFDKDDRPRALSLLNVGMPLGIFAGILFGGFANQWIGWRLALVAAGAPGLVIAALLQFTVREHRPPRAAGHKGPGAAETMRFLLGRRAYVRTVIGSFFSGFALYALFTWTPSLFIRIHHMGPAQVGSSVGLALGLCGALGTFAGGALVSGVCRRDDRWKAGQPALACLLGLPFLIAMLLVRDTTTALLCLAAGSFLFLSLLGPLYSVYQCVVPATMRSLATAIHNFLGTIGGLGLGALFVGMLSDHFKPAYGADALRVALVFPISCLLPAALFYWWAAQAIREEIVADQG